MDNVIDLNAWRQGDPAAIVNTLGIEAAAERFGLEEHEVYLALAELEARNGHHPTS